MNTPGATPTQWMTPAEQYSATREHLQAFNKKYLGLTDYAQTSALLGKTFYTLLIQSRDNILREWLWMAMLGIFCTGLAHSLFVASLRVLKARTTAVIFALEPIYGIALAWLLFSEVPTLRMLAGGLLIVSAIFLSARMAK